MIENNNCPTYRRQRFLLAFIRQLQTDVTSTDLQKLVFLYTMKEGSDFYEFIPYRFGSYSFQLAEDVEILRRDGYLSIESNPESTRIMAIGKYPQVTSFQILTERGNKLIRTAYRKYPYYAINSEIISRLFYGEEAELFASGKKKYTQINQVLFTIGYEGKSIEAFVNSLIRNDIRLLCDVRKNPLSRKFGFSKGKIERITDAVGISYLHFPDLGIDPEKRNLLETAEDYKVLFQEYSKTLPTLKPELERLYTLLCQNVRIALMCFEKDAVMCHRNVIRNYITNMHLVRSEDL